MDELNEKINIWDLFPSLKVNSNQKERFELEDYESEQILRGLKRLNFFLGPNNSGKSQLMRALMNQFGEVIIFDDQSILVKELQNLDKWLTKDQGKSVKIGSVSNMDSVVNYFWNSRFNSAIGPINKKRVTLVGLGRASQLYLSLDDGRNEYPLEFKEEQLKKIGQLDQRLNEIDKTQNKKYYVATDRKLYSKANREAFDIQLKTSLFPNSKDVILFTGSEMYNEILNLRTSSFQNNQDLLEFEKYLSNKFFEGKAVFISPVPENELNKQEKELHIKIGDEPDRPFYQLGEGIQSLIIITYLSQFKDKALIAIEEPENNLHPGLQRKLVEVLLESKRDNMILATTHSNHFLEWLNNGSEEVSFYRVEKSIEENSFKQKATKIEKAEVEILDFLGVSNQSVYLANCVIWVEGITDFWYLRRYLDVFKESLSDDNSLKAMNEGLHYAFAFSGGNLLHHFSFEEGSDTLRLSGSALANRFLVIVDQANPKIYKEFYERLQSELGANFFELTVREIENTLNQNVVKKVVNSYSSMSSLSLNNCSSEDWASLGIGYLIDKKMVPIKDQPSVGKHFSEKLNGNENSTINNKSEFAKEAISHIDSYDHLSDYVKSVLLPILQKFILAANPK